MSGLAAVAPLVVMGLLCAPGGVAALRRLLGARARRGLPLLADRWGVVETGSLGVLGLALGSLGPWHAVPVAWWGAAAACTALVAVVGALEWRRLPAVVPDQDGRRGPTARAASALCGTALAAASVLAVSGALAG